MINLQITLGKLTLSISIQEAKKIYIALSRINLYALNHNSVRTIDNIDIKINNKWISMTYAQARALLSDLKSLLEKEKEYIPVEPVPIKYPWKYNEENIYPYKNFYYKKGIKYV